MGVTDEELSRYAGTFMRQYNVDTKQMKKLLKNREFLNDAMMELLRAKVFKHVADSAQFYHEGEEEPRDDRDLLDGRETTPHFGRRDLADVRRSHDARGTDREASEHAIEDELSR